MMPDDDRDDMTEDAEHIAADKEGWRADGAIYELFIGLTGVYSIIVAGMLVFLQLFMPKSELLPAL